MSGSSILISRIFTLTIIGSCLFAGTARAYIDEVTPPASVISSYKPTYFLVGHPDTKIEISFKAQVIPAIQLYFGYSQLMRWELFQYSSPFHDINYNPEFFHRLMLGEAANERWIDISPFEHESNGGDVDVSRSWNRAYVRYSDTVFFGEGDPASRMKAHWSLKAWVPYLANPSEIPKYRGVWEATFTVSGFLSSAWDRGDLTLRIYPGGDSYTNPVNGGQELTFRAKFRTRGFLPLFVIQAFRGYSEDLLDYNRKTFGFRVGVGF